MARPRVTGAGGRCCTIAVGCAALKTTPPRLKPRAPPTFGLPQVKGAEPAASGADSPPGV